MGCFSGDSVDYPDIAALVAGMVSRHESERGILVCGTGLGMCIVANKFNGVRAASCHDDLTAEMSRRHNDANVLCLSAEILPGARIIDRIIETWLSMLFDGGRHLRRIENRCRRAASGRRSPPAVGCRQRGGLLPLSGADHRTILCGGSPTVEPAAGGGHAPFLPRPAGTVRHVR